VDDDKGGRAGSFPTVAFCPESTAFRRYRLEVPKVESWREFDEIAEKSIVKMEDVMPDNRSFLSELASFNEYGWNMFYLTLFSYVRPYLRFGASAFNRSFWSHIKNQRLCYALDLDSMISGSHRTVTWLHLKFNDSRKGEEAYSLSFYSGEDDFINRVLFDAIFPKTLYFKSGHFTFVTVALRVREVRVSKRHSVFSKEETRLLDCESRQDLTPITRCIHRYLDGQFPSCTLAMARNGRHGGCGARDYIRRHIQLNALSKIGYQGVEKKTGCR